MCNIWETSQVHLFGNLEIWLSKGFHEFYELYSPVAVIFPISVVHGGVSRLNFDFLFLPVLIVY